MSAYEILKARGVTRLCHFTKFQSLTHILVGEGGILPSNAICQDTKNVNDSARYDGELESVCCSVQYPNSWFMKRAEDNNQDRIFRDWVVLYIDPDILNAHKTKFCPCNASKGSGRYICGNMDEVERIFSDRLPTFPYPRSGRMLPCCPTDGQAELLIEQGVPRKYISGIAVGTPEMAGRIYGMLADLGLKKQIGIWIAPDVLTRNWSSIVREGGTPTETLYDSLREE